eukprot:TRINITY_DN3587_c0_g1_i1.p1 TRINITY_DN3587_c0_g1~~TRINITY_DN3587_c0_g1_i1.p1  ORF type:complete len:219 (+),score=82.71 TRINITY_DN3587_c0_g1_i1:125-781(+)
MSLDTGLGRIAGGSLEGTRKIPSLRILCLDLCARHISRLENLGHMPLNMYLDMLERAHTTVTPEIVSTLEQHNPTLLCRETDVGYWKPVVEGHILRRYVPAPFAARLSEMERHHAALQALLDHASGGSGGGSGDDGGSSSGAQKEAAALAALHALSAAPMPLRLMQEAGVVKPVSKLRKFAGSGPRAQEVRRCFEKERQQQLRPAARSQIALENPLKE